MNAYLLAARPKTLPAAVVPVWLGCVMTYHLTGGWDLRLAVFTLLGAVWIQIATNFFNDAIDADKGADTDARLGPTRATASGQLSRRSVYASAVLCLLFAAGCGWPLIQERGWVMLAIGIPSFYLAYGYTGGPLPLAYKGLGELFVILFFGLLAVSGTVFVQTGTWYSEALILGVAVGCLSAVLIAINNLRDREEDRKHGKNTLAVKWGRSTSLKLLAAMTVAPYALILVLDLTPSLLVAFIPPMALGLWILMMVCRTAAGPVYNKFLALAAVQLLLFAVAFQIAAYY
ncbi:1,4-dihydroxy-2-naphthoate octaprenyltransferase [Verrucomicrobiaceae bacterium N1E253]|uniref:1,4-dihydroxy-2-naphthoate octaprenyltransferase n=1 Tax=Oceaniferula marina TaxID=2748318 RepID=A0A851GI93_9BACT|nr:1,4-dihydroxy-2-naphthoate octaprenyltransferase [Oceaniferula marina]NWK56642.1 1,4-dihydroxy-2-naphthoate octaprenyltransferase [Oceaniferula marina]